MVAGGEHAVLWECAVVEGATPMQDPVDREEQADGRTNRGINTVILPSP